jgi:serine/threonine-protein kinase RsbT
LAPISTVDDIIAAPRMGRSIAAQAGQSVGEVTEVATAISEIARNIVLYAGSGVMGIRLIDDRTITDAVGVVGAAAGSQL